MRVPALGFKPPTITFGGAKTLGLRMSGTPAGTSPLLPSSSCGQLAGNIMDVWSARGRFCFVPDGSLSRTALLAAALAVLLTTPSLAQDAGVSGIAPGPGNANGLNGSIRDPSGVGNASRLPQLPPPAIRPVTPTTVAPL